MENKISTEELIETEIKTNDSLKLYLDEIGRYPLLNQKEEIDLSNRIKNGDMKARDKFIKSNLRLVVSIAKLYVGRGIEFLDLIQEGNLGLLKAMDNFDITKGYKFSTYATYWIKQRILRALAEKSKNIKLTIKAYDQVRKFKAIEAELQKELYREPKIEEIAIRMNISVEKAMQIYYNSLEIMSLNTPVGESGEQVLEDLLFKNDNYIEDEYINKEMIKQVHELIVNAGLKPRELEILILKFFKQKTLREIGEIYDVYHQLITYNINSAFKKIKKVNGVNNLKCYL